MLDPDGELFAMDVKCERCATEYEFDDALVSGRGTTVKCTNCGHKFKIRRSDGDFSEDFWNITTSDGRTLVFTSLRELQRAIQGYLVERDDLLSRGGLPPKAIGQIPELVPFFDQREAPRRSVGPWSEPITGSVRPRQATRPEFPAPPPNDTFGKTTLVGTGPLTSEPAFHPRPNIPSVRVPPPIERQPTLGFEVPLVSPAPPSSQLERDEPSLTRRESTVTERLQRPTSPPASSSSSVATRSEQATRSSESIPVRASVAGGASPTESRGSRDDLSPSARPSPASVVDTSSSPPPGRSLLAEIERDRAARGSAASVPEPSPPARRGVGGVVVTVVVLGGLLMLGAVWAQKNLSVTFGERSSPAPLPSPAADPRAMTFLANGERALADGDLVLAKESFDKASALAEKDPQVLVALARLAAVRADVLWLRSRLLPADAADEHRITRDGLDELAAGARRAADDALVAAPDEPAALRAKIDALRISGEREGARAFVTKIASSSGPETAYVLAALDLAEVEPLWSTVLERLEVAASAEAGPGRARASLVYALARAGDAAAAEAEIDRLDAMARPHPLLPLLRSFAVRAKAHQDEGALDGGLAAPAAPATAGGKGKKAGALPSDPRELVAQGDRARVRGDYERARKLFAAAIAKNPNDSEALAGLAAIAYARRDLNGARATYKRVIAINPNYMPAVIGLADVEWDAGDRVTASRMYKDIMDRYPEGAYPPRVKQRAEGGR